MSSLYEGSEREELIAMGGRKTEGKATNADIEKALEAVRRVMNVQSDGFVILMEDVPQADGSTDTQGIVKVSNKSKADIFVMVLKALEFDDVALRRLFLTYLASLESD